MEELYQREVPVLHTLLKVICYIQYFVHLKVNFTCMMRQGTNGLQQLRQVGRTCVYLGIRIIVEPCCRIIIIS